MTLQIVRIPPPMPWPVRSYRQARQSFVDQLAHMRRRWYLYLPVFAIWALAYVRLFLDPTPRSEADQAASPAAGKMARP